MIAVKNWRRKLLYLLAVGCLFIPVFPDPPVQSDAFVQSVTATTAVVARIEPVPRALSLEVTTLDGVTVSEQPLSAEVRRHAFRVEELEPGTRYRYVVRDSSGDPVSGGEGEFSTAPVRDDHAFRFAVVGDSGGQPWWVWMQNNALFYPVSRYRLLPARSDPRAVGARLFEAKPDLLLHVGDVIYPRGEHRHYGPGFFQPFADVLRIAPCYVALGNHDVMQDRGRQCLRNLVMPENEITGDERFCSFAWGPVRFVLLDLNPFGEKNELFGAGTPALEFLDHALAGTSEPWRIVAAHYPVYSASRQRDRGDMIENLLPALRRHRVDLLFVGHDHNYQRFGEPDEDDPVIVVTGGGGKSTYELREHDKVAHAEEVFHFTRVDVDGARMEIVGVDRDGREFGAFELDLRQRAAAREGFDPAANPRDQRIQALLK